ncbi:hypothetical protein [Maricaulis maris]|uniref:hypothetical protein n=1 Tax=Maricaulis maris TaxID=74318 RepID=UPI00292169BD|nr:hypothetical protein MACH15_01600 [Maricaulis maris]
MTGLAQRVSIASRYQKSIRLDADMGEEEALSGYICAPSITQLVRSMADQISDGKQAAFTWTGPYGGGKSSLAVVFSGLFAKDAATRKAAQHVIGSESAAAMADAVPSAKKGWEVAALVGSKSNPIIAIARAIGLEGNITTDAELIERIELRMSETPGLLLIVDEMGKFLEAAAEGDADMHVFQQLAELANRSQGRFILIGILHQAFGDYAGRVSRQKRDEWSKIQGRFSDLVVNLAEEEQLEVISRAIVTEDVPPTSFKKSVKSIAACSQSNRRGNGSNLTATLERCWPLHPVAALLLGPISRRRFGQNQRSVFGFLNSFEPHGFRSFLRDADPVEIYAPWRLWDYLQINLEASILASPDAHRWATAADALSRAESVGASPEHIRTLKAISIIDLFGERAGLTASTEVLQNCGANQACIDDLARWSLIVFRKFKNAYAVFAGSDFDIDAALSEAYREGPGLKLSRLTELAALHPVLAKRSYHSSGAMRWFSTLLLTPEDLQREAAPNLPSGAIGAFCLLVPLGGEPSEELAALTKAALLRWNAPGMIIGESPRTLGVVDFASELVALEHVQESNVDLAGDGVARREVASRIAELRSRAEVELQLAIGSAKWTTSTGKAVRLVGAARSQLASDIAEQMFPKQPIVQNELLNRDKPSSNAIAAQNLLLRAMTLAEGAARLGISGFPAEGGLYAALLEATGLHREACGTWKFCPPPPKHDTANLGPIWSAAEKHLVNNREQTVGLDELYDLWSAPPFGLKAGLMPVIGLAFILSMRDKIAFYREGVFQPAVKDVDADVLARDASDIQLRWMDLSVDAKAMLSEMAETVRELDGGNELLDLQPIDVARGLISIFSKLPLWTTRTLRLSKNALRVRNLFKKAHDPNKLLFDDLPRELGLEGSHSSMADISDGVQGALRELVNAYPGAVQRLEILLLSELNVPSENAEALADLRERAINVQRLSGNHQIDAFVGRLAKFEGKLEDMEGLISLVLSKPSSMWSDADLDRAALELADHAQQFNRLEAYARVKGRPDHRHAVALVLGIEGKPTPVAYEFEITKEQRAKADALSKRLTEVLTGIPSDSTEVVLAALAKCASDAIQDKTQAIDEVSA